MAEHSFTLGEPNPVWFTGHCSDGGTITASSALVRRMKAVWEFVQESMDCEEAREFFIMDQAATKPVVQHMLRDLVSIDTLGEDADATSMQAVIGHAWEKCGDGRLKLQSLIRTANHTGCNTLVMAYWKMFSDIVVSCKTPDDLNTAFGIKTTNREGFEEDWAELVKLKQ
jgi:hypothetical protein